MINVIEYKKYDVINGPGIRCSIWLAGCNNHCKQCWSPQTWNPNQGEPLDYDILKTYINNSRIDGISILGGDPFYHLFNNNAYDETLKFLHFCNIYNKSIWIWTGYLYEDIKGKYPELLKYITVLIDGKYDYTKRNLNLKWRGSSNQRIINVQESLKNNKIILLND